METRGEMGGGDVGEGVGETYLEGPESMVQAVQQKSKDNADGTNIVTFRVKAAEVPRDLLTSPDGSMWRLTLGVEGGRTSMVGSRLTMADAAAGHADLRFQVMPAGLDPGMIWGQRGRAALLGLRMLAGRNPYPHFVDRGERAASMRRAAMFCREPDFGDWICDQVRSAGLPVAAPCDVDLGIGIDADTAVVLRARENLCRAARIHSRSEMLTSNVAAERVEGLMRAYREHIWTRTSGRRAAEAASRGIR